jgi:hypothetical protein
MEGERDQLQTQLKQQQNVMREHNNEIANLQSRLRILETSLEQTKTKLAEKNVAYDQVVRRSLSLSRMPSTLSNPASGSSTIIPNGLTGLPKLGMGLTRTVSFDTPTGTSLSSPLLYRYADPMKTITEKLDPPTEKIVKPPFMNGWDSRP